MRGLRRGIFGIRRFCRWVSGSEGELRVIERGTGQADFGEQRFQESLAREGAGHEDERDQYFGLSLRELLHTFRWQILVLLKCMLLQRKVRWKSRWSCRGS